MACWGSPGHGPGGDLVGDVERRVDVAASGDARRKGGGNGEFRMVSLGGGFKYFLCSPLVGEMIQFD